MDDCGLSITKNDIHILTNLSSNTLHYLVLLRRDMRKDMFYLLDVQDPYITTDAMNAIFQCQITHPHLTIFLGSVPKVADIRASCSSVQLSNSDTYASSIAPVDQGLENKQDYDRLVTLGHVAAFRMYDEKQLLPPSYFTE